MLYGRQNNFIVSFFNIELYMVIYIHVYNSNKTSHSSCYLTLRNLVVEGFSLTNVLSSGLIDLTMKVSKSSLNNSRPVSRVER